MDSGEKREVLNDDWQIEPGNVVCPWEVEAQDTVTQVKGRLKGKLSYWRDELKAPQLILDIIEHGYILPLKSEPTPFARINQASAIANKALVTQSVDELLVAGCIREVTAAPRV